MMEERKKRKRSTGELPDISALLGYDAEKESESPPKRRTSKRRNDRQSSKLDDSDFDSIDSEKLKEDDVEKEKIIIPEEFEHYLPPDLWRKLKKGNPSKGVLINALDRLRSVQYLISTYIPRNLVQEKMQRMAPGLVNSEVLRGSLLFADVSGFTALSEHMAIMGKEGAERLTDVMNQYFSRMLEILAWSGGILIKFAGDALLVYFPEMENGEQVNRAVRAALRMLRAIADFAEIETPDQNVQLNMKIGIATGDFFAASIGSQRRMEYGVWGKTVTETMQAEGIAKTNQLIINRDTALSLDAEFIKLYVKDGFLEVLSPENEALDDFEIAAEKRRARSAIPWDASPGAILKQMHEVYNQINVLIPYIAPELVTKIVVHAKKRRIDSEFRPTTVLFCNFTGPEELLALWGDEGKNRVMGLLNAYFSTVQEVIDRYGGIISRIDPYSQGTKLLALFGAPLAHEDDPLRAVSAALAMNAELQIINSRWYKKLKRYLPKGFRSDIINQSIGLTHGDTFAGQVGSSTRREYTVMGDDVNLAARLMGAAKYQQILVNERVFEIVKDYFSFTLLQPIRVKGKSNLIQLYQVDGPLDDTLGDRINARDKLIGRLDELEKINQILLNMTAGNCKLLTIQGPPGVGKSHLAETVASVAMERDVRALFYHCRSFDVDTPYACWSGLLRVMSGITTVDHPIIRQEKMAQLFNRVNLEDKYKKVISNLMGIEWAGEKTIQKTGSKSDSDEGEDIDQLSALLKSGRKKRKGSSLELFLQLDRWGTSNVGQIWQGYSGGLSKEEKKKVAEALANLFEKISQVEPVLIYFEDTQWMDTASKSLLASIKTAISSARLLFLLVRRGDEDDEEIGEIINLKSLSLTETSDFVSHILVDELAQLIYQQSDGNPMFVEEITRWLQRTRKISVSDLRDVLQTSNVLQKLVLTSLEKLPEFQKEVIRVAAICGVTFRYGEAEALLPDTIPAATLSGYLRELVKQGFLYVVERGVNPLYGFQQNIVRDVVYSSMPFETRRDLHKKLADYLKSGQSGREQVHARIAAFLDESREIDAAQNTETIAEHYEMAECWLLAGEYYLQSADSAKDNSQYARSLQNFKKAYTVVKQAEEEAAVQKSGDQVLRIMLRSIKGQADISFLKDEYSHAIRLYQSALELCDNEFSSDEQQEITIKQAMTNVVLGKFSDASRLIKTCWENEGNREDGLLLILTAWILWKNDDEELDQWFEQAEKVLGNAEKRYSRILLALIHEYKSEWDIARSIYLEQNQVLGAAFCLISKGDWEVLSDENPPQLILDEYEEARGLLEIIGEVSCGLAIINYRTAEVYWKTGDEEKSIRLLNTALELVKKSRSDIQVSAKQSIKGALEIVKKGQQRQWPDWRWPGYVEAYYVDLFYVVCKDVYNWQ